MEEAGSALVQVMTKGSFFHQQLYIVTLQTTRGRTPPGIPGSPGSPSGPRPPGAPVCPGGPMLMGAGSPGSPLGPVDPGGPAEPGGPGRATPGAAQEIFL